MALALYRKYRPATFAEVVGQEHVTEPLRTALASGRINHAYLFSGPRGCGKTSSARILARSLNCERGPTPDPCGVCSSCVALAPEGPGSLDVIELDAASHGGVSEARDLRDKAFYLPAESRYRVFIIDEAHMVTKEGFNALLKIVEEPPEHLVFIFATTEPDKVLTTIRSRTHHYPFRLIPPATLRGLLERLCAEEGVTVAPAVFPLVVRAGGGSARDSLSILDQMIAGAGPGGVSYAEAVALLGVTDEALIDEAVDALAAGDAAGVFGAVDKVVEAGHDPRRYAGDLLQRLRDLVILAQVPRAAASGIIDAAEDQLDAMTAQAERLGAATAARFAEILHAGLIDMRGTTAPRLTLELLCARMLLPAASDGEGVLLQRLERLERRLEIGAAPAPAAAAAAPAPAAAPVSAPARPAAVPREAPRPAAGSARPPARAAAGPPAGPDLGLPTPPTLSTASTPGPRPERPAVARPERPAAAHPPTPPPTPSPTPVSAPTADQPSVGADGAVDAADVRRVWTTVLQAVQRRRRTTQVLLENATVARVDDGSTLVLTMPTPGLARRVVEPANGDLLREALHEVLGVSWTIRCEVADRSTAPGGGRQPDPRQPDRQQRDTHQRDSQQRGRPEPGKDAGVRRPPAEQYRSEPLPPEPPPEEDYADDIPDDYGTTDAGGSGPVRDPEEAAIELLTAQLGARRLDPQP